MVITAKDVETIYEVPLVFHQEGLDDKIIDLLQMWTRSPKLGPWEDIVNRLKFPQSEVTIGVVGKYVHLTDSYKSLNEALIHGGIEHHTQVHLNFVDSEALESLPAQEVEILLTSMDAILVPGGFGNRGIEGKIKAIEIARKNSIPFLGICLGMQMAVVEFARNVANLPDANSREFSKDCKNPVIALMEDQKGVKKGGTMRLGNYPCEFKKNSKAQQIYGVNQIQERHRHRFEFNNKYRERLKRAGLILSGSSPDNLLVEMIELKDHPWFLGCQFHPEFKSRPTQAHPLFSHFIEAAIEHQKKRSSDLRTNKAGKKKEETEKLPLFNDINKLQTSI
jgi:CTP synthase